jgi:hypothetical protein
MVMKLKQFPNMKFIWAEISYLARWWADQSTQVFTPTLSILCPVRRVGRRSGNLMEVLEVRKQWMMHMYSAGCIPVNRRLEARLRSKLRSTRYPEQLRVIPTGTLPYLSKLKDPNL